MPSEIVYVEGVERFDAQGRPSRLALLVDELQLVASILLGFGTI